MIRYTITRYRIRKEYEKMDDNDKFREALERLDLMHEEMAKLRRALISIQDGTPFTEAFNDEFLEEILKSDEVRASYHVASEIEQLLEMKYCTNNRNYDNWVTSIDTHREEVIMLTSWLSRKNQYVYLINRLKEEMQDHYETGIELYKREMKKYQDLREGLTYIPEKCPWELDELMDDDIEDLLEKLPDME